jgi:hypothetical protein
MNRLFNTLWLIANDIIFGRTSGQILMENSEPLAAWLEYHLQVNLDHFSRLYSTKKEPPEKGDDN